MTRQERLTLVRLLLDLDQPVNGDEIARAWDIEISARVKAVDEGRVSGSNTYVVASFKPLRLPREIGERGVTSRRYRFFATPLSRSLPKPKIFSITPNKCSTLARTRDSLRLFAFFDCSPVCSCAIVSL